jgi:hypothetical protein
MSSFYGKVDSEGKIHLDQKERWSNFLQSLKDQSIHITLEKKKNKRSRKQNNYLWGGVYETISHDTGHTPQELHHIFRSMFLTYEMEFNGKLVKLTKSTASLTAGEMVDYIMNIAAEVALLGITLPDPNKWDPVKMI